jgi:hypothetical protein
VSNQFYDCDDVSDRACRARVGCKGCKAEFGLTIHPISAPRRPKLVGPKVKQLIVDEMLASSSPSALPATAAERKDIPMARGCLDYFPAALAAVAAVSKKGNDQHNPGQDMHHARGKSTDHADCIVRHLMDRGTVDAVDGVRHSAKVAWRALALLQEELEREAGAPLARGAKVEVVP